MERTLQKMDGKFNTWIDKLLSRVPALGKLLSTLFGGIELPLLDLFHLIDKIFKVNTATLVGQKIFRGRWGSKVVPIERTFFPETKFLPSEEILSLIERSGVLGIAWCYCRTRAMQRGEKTCEIGRASCRERVCVGV